MPLGQQNKISYRGYIFTNIRQNSRNDNDDADANNQLSFYQYHGYQFCCYYCYYHGHRHHNDIMIMIRIFTILQKDSIRLQTMHFAATC